MNKKLYGEQLKKLFREVLRSINRVDMQFIKKYNISLSASQILEDLGTNKRLKMKDIAIKIGVEMSTATRLIDHLIKRKLVKRIRDKKDRRIVYVALTYKGKKLEKEISDIKRKIKEGILDYINDEVIIKKSIEGFKNIVEAYKKYESTLV